MIQYFLNLHTQSILCTSPYVSYQSRILFSLSLHHRKAKQWDKSQGSNFFYSQIKGSILDKNPKSPRLPCLVHICTWLKSAYRMSRMDKLKHKIQDMYDQSDPPIFSFFKKHYHLTNGCNSYQHTPSFSLFRGSNVVKIYPSSLPPLCPVCWRLAE